MKVPSPADAPTLTAAELVATIRERGGRILRMQVPPSTFVLTNDGELAQWLVSRGATLHAAAVLKKGSYKRAHDGIEEWDAWVHVIPVLGEETVWEVAGRG